MKEFDEFTAGLQELPTLPVVVARVLEVVEDHGSSANDLVDIIQKDQAIAAKVVKVANSAYYGLPNKVSSISHAIVLLGFETVRNLCLGVGVFRSFLPYRLHEFVDMERFWEHTIATAVCTRMIRGGDKSREESEEMFLTGLIHDVGRLCLLAAAPDRYVKLILRAKREQALMVDAEQGEFGGTHAQLGGALCRHWSFAPQVVEPVTWHHDPENAPEAMVTRAAEVSLANVIVQKRGFRWTPDAVMPAYPPFVLERLGLSQDDVDAVGDRLEARRAEIESFTTALM